MAQHAPLVAGDRAPLGTISGKSAAMEEQTATGLPDQIRRPGTGRGVPSFASWLVSRS
jgi:hypothetical protein